MGRQSHILRTARSMRRELAFEYCTVVACAVVGLLWYFDVFPEVPRMAQECIARIW